MASQITLSRAPCACAASSGRLSSARVAAAGPRPSAAFFRQQRSSGKLAARRQQTCVRAVLEVASKDFNKEVLESSTTVLVDFWAPWCGPCKLVAPLMDWAEKEYEGRLKVVKVLVDEHPEVVEKYKVYGLPCLIMFRDGQEVEGSHREGAVSKKVLIEYLEKVGGFKALADA